MARHAELRGGAGSLAGVLPAAADSGRPVRPVRNLLRAFLTDEVPPDARAEERTLYRAARRDPAVGLATPYGTAKNALIGLSLSLRLEGADLR